MLPWASSVSAISIAPWWCTIINCRKSRSKSAPDAAVSCCICASLIIPGIAMVVAAPLLTSPFLPMPPMPMPPMSMPPMSMPAHVHAAHPVVGGRSGGRGGHGRGPGWPMTFGPTLAAVAFIGSSCEQWPPLHATTGCSGIDTVECRTGKWELGL